MKYQAYVLLGPPGSGKGLQGQLLNGISGLVHVSIEDVFSDLGSGSELAKMYAEYSGQGNPMLNVVIVDLLHYHLRKLTREGQLRPESDKVVLDGIPANATQAEALRSFVDVRLVINLWVPCHEELRRRMREQAVAGGRAGAASDNALDGRLRRYVHDAAALIRSYESMTRVVISAAPPMVVFREILGMIKVAEGDSSDDEDSDEADSMRSRERLSRAVPILIGLD